MAGQASELVEKFRWKFPDSGEPRVYRSPGRINLIGDHTDYNEGFVLPMAIELACWVATSENGTNRLRIHTEDRPGILAKISARIASEDTNIKHVEAKTFDNKKGLMTLTVDVTDVGKLEQLCKALADIDGVLRVTRVVQ